MQLNSLTLNPNTTPLQFKSQLAIYDHKLAVVNTQIFVFGKYIQNFTIQTPLHKINLLTLRVEPVYTVSPPLLEDFMMFSFQSNIYLWGKTAISQKNELFQFDGLKFAKMDQIGTVPQLGSSYSFTKFSHKYLLVFGYLPQDQFQNKWYIFDIKKLQWKTVVSNIQLPVCQKSQLIWANGRGYLLLRSTYDKKKKTFTKNILYEVKFKSFSRLLLECIEIQLSPKIKGENLIFTDLIHFDDRQLMILGGQQISYFPLNEKQSNSKVFQRYGQKSLKKIEGKVQMKFESQTDQNSNENQKTSQRQHKNDHNLNMHKKVYKLDLQSFQWSTQPQIIPIKGQNMQVLAYNHKLYTLGGTLNSQLLSQIQCYDFRSQKPISNFPYEQSLCYYCECAFTYKQQMMYQPIVESEYEKFCPKNRIQNKFLKKLAQSINTELHAIGMICEYLRHRKSQLIQLNLFEYAESPPYIQMVKPKIEVITNQVLSIKGKTLQSSQQSILAQVFSSEQNFIDPITMQNFYLNFTQLKIASFKLGYGLLYVASTEQGSTFVGYCSYSQTQFPESNYRSFSQTFYTLKLDRVKNSINYSSENKRNILFENVKLHFGNPSQYQNLEEMIQSKKKGQRNHFVNIYIIGTTNLQKSLSLEHSYFEDIQVKSLSKKNPFNSLRTYLKHLYLSENINFRLSLQNNQVQLINIYEQFQKLAKTKTIIEISTSQDISLKKAQNQQTHFSTNQDETIVSWKKIQTVDRCKFYEIKKNQQNQLSPIYRTIFVYQNRKLVKTISAKMSVICGVIELADSLELKLNGGDLASISEQRNLLRWIEQIECTLVDEIDYHKEQL